METSPWLPNIDPFIFFAPNSRNASNNHNWKSRFPISYFDSKYFPNVCQIFPISSVKIYCSHCPLGAASLMHSHIDFISEKRESANVGKNMIYQIPQKYRFWKHKNKYTYVVSDLKMLTSDTAASSILILEDCTLIYVWDGLSFMNSNAFPPNFIWQYHQQ